VKNEALSDLRVDRYADPGGVPDRLFDIKSTPIYGF
jgi:hypothetical protein